MARFYGSGGGFGTVAAAVGLFIGVLVLIGVLALFESWLVLTVVNWAWPELPDFCSPTFEHIVGFAVVLWVLQATFKANLKKGDD